MRQSSMFYGFYKRGKKIISGCHSDAKIMALFAKML